MRSYLSDRFTVIFSQVNYIVKVNIRLEMSRTGDSRAGQHRHSGNQQKHHHLRDTSSLDVDLWKTLFQVALEFITQSSCLQVVLRSWLRTQDLYSLCSRLCHVFPLISNKICSESAVCVRDKIFLIKLWLHIHQSFDIFSMNCIYRINFHTSKKKNLSNKQSLAQRKERQS